jgi:SAM-dependent methyltransferase/uncharacterized protein YbaR (Trm112 family)
VRRRHFETLAPVCPRCRADGVGDRPLRLATVVDEADGDVLTGLIHCSDARCQREFPIVDGIPLLVPDVQRFVADALVYLNARDDLPPELASLFGDCAGASSTFDVARQHLSIYAWDAYGEFDPREVGVDGGGLMAPGAVVRCLDHGVRGLPHPGKAPVLDLGCAVGRSTFELASRAEGLVLGIDLSIPMLRLAQRILRTGEVRYPRRRVGVVYDERVFPVSFEGTERVDFWACDALALPFGDRAFGRVVGLNVLDCVASPADLLARVARLLRPGGTALLSTPYDWSPAATAPQAWLGGHSQRGAGEGASEPLLRSLLRGGGHPMEIDALRLLAETEHFPWHARLHDRAVVSYDVHVIGLEASSEADEPPSE